jgi:hypothetical protein
MLASIFWRARCYTHPHWLLEIFRRTPDDGSSEDCNHQDDHQKKPLDEWGVLHSASQSTERHLRPAAFRTHPLPDMCNAVVRQDRHQANIQRKPDKSNNGGSDQRALEMTFMLVV